MNQKEVALVSQKDYEGGGEVKVQVDLITGKIATKSI